ncbi:uncharacterized protein LOC121873103 [Homarus americanus]|uniref:uncharacterized protein LOC121873103 n=1 Tax=Homarus americanus TaxID=6706 RepID=UPI001C465C9B|nr:uncharacterized protein LOC121873103 [Homarus americanus]
MASVHRKGGGYWWCKASWVLLLGVTLMAVVTEAGLGVKYLVGEAGTRGTDLIISWVAASLSVCCLACHKETQCVGFNWVSSSKMCQTLSSLRNVVEDTTCNLYVADSTPITSVGLKFDCENCHGTQPYGVDTWVHQCEPRTESLAVGVATSISLLTDLDFLLCRTFPGLMLETDGGGVLTDDRNCWDVINNGGLYMVTSVWGDNQFFDNPKTFAHQCRKILSPDYKVDRDRCVAGQEKLESVAGASGRYHLLVCPPHMAAFTLSFIQDVGPSLTCCLIY